MEKQQIDTSKWTFSISLVGVIGYLFKAIIHSVHFFYTMLRISLNRRMKNTSDCGCLILEVNVFGFEITYCHDLLVHAHTLYTQLSTLPSTNMNIILHL